MLMFREQRIFTNKKPPLHKHSVCNGGEWIVKKNLDLFFKKQIVFLGLLFKKGWPPECFALGVIASITS